MDALEQRLGAGQIAGAEQFGQRRFVRLRVESGRSSRIDLISEPNSSRSPAIAQ